MECEKWFIIITYLIAHLKLWHVPKDICSYREFIFPITNTEWICVVSVQKSLNVQVHCEDTWEVKKCMFCLKSFVRKISFVVTLENSWRTCVYCQKTFAHTGNLFSQLWIQSDSFNLCEKTFSAPGHLEFHIWKITQRWVKISAM